MFWHNFKYCLKTIFKSRMLIFWTFAFPLILGTLFYLAFSDIAEKESFKAIDIAVVEDKNIETNDILVDAFDSLSDETSDEKLFNTKYITEDEAKKLLEDEKITGYFVVADEPRIVIKANGINETIFKFSAEQIMQTTDMIEAISEEQIAQKIKAGDYNIDAEQIYNEGLQIAQKEYKNIKQEENKNLDYMMIEFYTLIAMTCLYGATIGLYAVNRALPNMGTKGMRMAVSPTQKSKLIISSACASFVVQVIGIAILFIYTIFALDVDYGENILLVVVLALLGCLAGLTLGIAIAALLKTSENTKIGIVIGFTMLCSFFAGMMGVEMKYMIDTNIPILNKINPANMITDGYYALYYYDSPSRFTGDIISLLIFAFVMIAISICSLRRQKYDSI